MKKIITISREFGAGGGEIGRKVAERLGYHYYDKELIPRKFRPISDLPRACLTFTTSRLTRPCLKHRQR